MYFVLQQVWKNLQNIYTEISQYQKAIEYGKKGLDIFSVDVHDPLNQSYCLSNLGIVYESLKKYDTAEIYFTEALQLSQRIGDQYAASAVLLNLGDIHYKTGRLEESKIKFDEAYLIAKKMNFRWKWRF